uniref:Hexosyltransferase n=1 Tax=Kalanchoe fedtschenkoi TaxID=63787 RepID=A0A7N0THI0_KALFE
MKQYTAPKPARRPRLVLPAFFLVILILCFLTSLNELRFDSTFITHFGKCALSTSNPEILKLNETTSAVQDLSGEEEELRILIGILTLPDNYNRRHFLRLVYSTQTLTTRAKVDVKFVFCNLTKEDQTVLVALEILRYDDILILDCKENMNNGKTYTYFSSLPSMFDSENDTRTPPYHYVMKGDDDTYFRVNALVASLRPLPRHDLYYGYVVPCPSMDPFKLYMSGMGYLVSWDLVRWVSESDIPRAHLDGPEDKTFGEWLRAGRKAKNRFNAKWSMYDYPEPKTRCTHELWNDTVAVHRLKTQEKWIKTLQFFNVTSQLRPSKLYHIP